MARNSKLSDFVKKDDDSFQDTQGNKISENLETKFSNLMKGGPKKSVRKGPAGVGNTIEYHLTIKENCKKSADIEGIEIKSTRRNTNSNITMVAPNPPPRGTNPKMRLKYGYPDPKNEFPETIMFCSAPITPQKFTNKARYTDWGFKLKIEEENKRLGLLVKNYKTGEEYQEDFFYPFELLKNHIVDKYEKEIMSLWLADRQIIGDDETFDYTENKIHDNFSFEKFLELLRVGKIVFEFRIDIDRNEQNLGGKNIGKRNPRYGKPHDHGNGFRMLRKVALSDEF